MTAPKKVTRLRRKWKAYDAIIAAAGIVAVLIANVTYLGELHMGQCDIS